MVIRHHPHRDTATAVAAKARQKLEAVIATGRKRAAHVIETVRTKRGFLFHRHGCLDSRAIMDAFVRACTDLGAVVADGYASDRPFALITLQPCLYEPVPDDPVVFGVVLEDSRFGDGGLSIGALSLRLASVTYLFDSLRIGEGTEVAGRTPDSDPDLETRRLAGAIRDVVLFQLAPERLERLQAAIQRAHEERIDSRQAGLLLRRSLTRAEAKRAVETFASANVERLPPGHTTWRLSNAVSWLAGPTQDAERKLQLMGAAGAMLPKVW